MAEMSTVHGVGGPRALPPRTTTARAAVRGTAWLSRRLGLGNGSTVGGRVGLAIDPQMLARLGQGRQIALVSGTNGKTTTTRLLVEALSGKGEVATSSAGANMAAGIVSALSEHQAAPLAVLEIDEAHLGSVCAALDPQVIVLLNLSRDQLDRVSEVRMLASRWKEALIGTKATVVANADDPLVVFASRQCEKLIWVAAGGLWHLDAYHCPLCDNRINYPEPGNDLAWSCSCGFARPEPDVRVIDGELVLADRTSYRLQSALPGRFNDCNAAMAAMAASAFGVGIGEALTAMSRVDEVAGRFASRRFAGGFTRMLLAKNPAGWTELIELVRKDSGPLVIAINARIADGHDPSWLWDVDFEALQGRFVVASGERRDDLAVRLRHAGVAHVVVEDQLAALQLVANERLDYIGNYTAFQQLRRALDRRERHDRLGTRHSQRTQLFGTAPPALPVAPLQLALAGAKTKRDPARGQSALVIVIVHPDLLGTYGDGGNGRILANRALWRDEQVELVLAPSDQPLPISGDIYCLGGGEDGPQLRAMQCLNDGRLGLAVDAGATVLAVCAGFQILGRSFPSAEGTEHHGLGLLDVKTVRFAGARAVGEMTSMSAVESLAGPLPVLSGFENHQGHTLLGSEVQPFGRVQRGIGNGEQGLDGAVSGRIIGTYLHGPVLARNPALADALLERALGKQLTALEDGEERALREARLASRNTSRPHWAHRSGAGTRRR